MRPCLRAAMNDDNGRMVAIGDISIANKNPFVFIGGPCVIESESKALESAQAIKKITDALKIPFVYKSSYDKANRSSADSFRGVGIDKGLRILEKVKNEIGVPVLSDVHSPEEIKSAKDLLDILQIPAFLCRQTDLLIAAGESGVPVNVKKGQFMAPWDMKNVIEKVEAGGGEKIMLTERGTSFGYNNLVVDMTGIPVMSAFGHPVIFDAGHSAQNPGGLGNMSGGRREAIAPLARCALAVGVAGVFLEVHENPDNAPCDGPNMWPLSELAELLGTLKKIDDLKRSMIL